LFFQQGGIEKGLVYVKMLTLIWRGDAIELIKDPQCMFFKEVPRQLLELLRFLVEDEFSSGVSCLVVCCVLIKMFPFFSCFME